MPHIKIMKFFQNHWSLVRASKTAAIKNVGFFQYNPYREKASRPMFWRMLKEERSEIYSRSPRSYRIILCTYIIQYINLLKFATPFFMDNFNFYVFRKHARAASPYFLYLAPPLVHAPFQDPNIRLFLSPYL
jgi:hypothetical protein